LKRRLQRNETKREEKEKEEPEKERQQFVLQINFINISVRTTINIVTEKGQEEKEA